MYQTSGMPPSKAQRKSRQNSFIHQRLNNIMDCLCQSLEHICIEQEKCTKCPYENECWCCAISIPFACTMSVQFTQFQLFVTHLRCVWMAWAALLLVEKYIYLKIYPIIWKRWRFNVATNVVWLPVIDFGDDFDNYWFRWLVWRWLTGFLVQTEGDKHFSLSLSLFCNFSVYHVFK